MRAAAADAILEAAEEVAAERGIEAASIAAIAERAGVAVGTLYNYFPDREGLITALFKSRRSELIPLITAIRDAHAREPFEPRLRGFVHDLLATYEARRGFVRIALDVDRTMPSVKDPRQTVMVTVIAALEEIFAEAGRKDLVPAGRHAQLARMLSGSLKALMLWQMDRGSPFTDDADLLIDTFLHGAGGRK